MNTSFVAYRKFYALNEAFAWLGIHAAYVSLLDTETSVIRIPTLKAPRNRNGWAILFSDGKVLCGNEELPDRKALVYPANPSSVRPKFALPSVGEVSAALEEGDLRDGKLRLGLSSNTINNQNPWRKLAIHINWLNDTLISPDKKSYLLNFTNILPVIEFNSKAFGEHLRKRNPASCVSTEIFVQRSLDKYPIFLLNGGNNGKI